MSSDLLRSSVYYSNTKALHKTDSSSIPAPIHSRSPLPLLLRGQCIEGASLKVLVPSTQSQPVATHTHTHT
jgi:hypothetical protein